MAQYVITDGTRWIMRDKHGRYVPTSCEDLADVFSNKQATGIFQSNLSKALKSVFRVQKIDETSKLIKQISQETAQKIPKEYRLLRTFNVGLIKLMG